MPDDHQEIPAGQSTPSAGNRSPEQGDEPSSDAAQRQSPGNFTRTCDLVRYIAEQHHKLFEVLLLARDSCHDERDRMLLDSLCAAEETLAEGLTLYVEDTAGDPRREHASTLETWLQYAALQGFRDATEALDSIDPATTTTRALLDILDTAHRHLAETLGTLREAATIPSHRELLASLVGLERGVHRREVLDQTAAERL
jgi:hypothetical protein